MEGIKILKYAALTALDIVFPATCAACSVWTGDVGSVVCPSCAEKFRFPDGVSAASTGCGKPSENASADACACRRASYDAVRAAAVYGGVVSDLVKKFKYHNAPRLAGFFAAALARAYARHPEIGGPDFVCPVPLHPWRRFRRGYNQSALAAQGFCRLTGLKYAPALLARSLSTRQQAKLDAASRRKNIEGAFVVPRRSVGAVTGKKILVIDDVMTTGATLDACARALKDVGAAKVFGLVIAVDL